MAIKKTELYSSLWASCDELRGGMDASQYKDYVLTLLFMKYVSDKYAKDPYGLIEVPAGATYDDMVGLKNDKEIGDKINKIISKLASSSSGLVSQPSSDGPPRRPPRRAASSSSGLISQPSSDGPPRRPPRRATSDLPASSGLVFFFFFEFRPLLQPSFDGPLLRLPQIFRPLPASCSSSGLFSSHLPTGSSADHLGLVFFEGPSADHLGLVFLRPLHRSSQELISSSGHRRLLPPEQPPFPYFLYTSCGQSGGSGTGTFPPGTSVTAFSFDSSLSVPFLSFPSLLTNAPSSPRLCSTGHTTSSANRGTQRTSKPRPLRARCTTSGWSWTAAGDPNRAHGRRCRT